MGYVDDTKTFITFSPCDLSKAVSDLNEDLNEISKWCCENSLLINPQKNKNSSDQSLATNLQTTVNTTH